MLLFCADDDRGSAGKDDDAMVISVFTDRMDATQSVSDAFYMLEQTEKME